MRKISRRSLLGGVVAAIAVGLAACGGSPETKTQGPASNSASDLSAPPALPSSPITLNVIDGGGDLQLSQPAIDQFVRTNSKLVSKVTYSKSTGWPLMPRAGGAIQPANRPGSTTGFIRLAT